MKSIFLSYAREDRAVAMALAEHLTRHGHEVWWDHALAAGSVFSKEIKRQIDKADVAIVLWSNASGESSWVLDEADLAKQAGKLMPVRIDDCAIPIGFGSVHTLDVQNRPEDFSRVLDALAGRVSEVKAKPKRGRGLAVLAVLIVAIAAAAGGAWYMSQQSNLASAKEAFLLRAADFDDPLPETAAAELGRCPAGPGFGAPGRRFRVGVWSIACSEAASGEIGSLYFWTEGARQGIAVTPSSNGWWEFKNGDKVRTIHTTMADDANSSSPSLYEQLKDLYAWNQTLPPGADISDEPFGVGFTQVFNDEARRLSLFVLDDLILVEMHDGQRLYLSRNDPVVIFRDNIGFKAF